MPVISTICLVDADAGSTMRTHDHDPGGAFGAPNCSAGVMVNSSSSSSSSPPRPSSCLSHPPPSSRCARRKVRTTGRTDDGEAVPVDAHAICLGVPQLASALVELLPQALHRDDPERVARDCDDTLGAGVGRERRGVFERLDDSGDRANLLARSKWSSQGLEDRAIIAACCTDTALSLGGLAPRKGARVAELPVTESTSAWRRTPLRPTLR